ncbi:unnamed protein product [Caretta caretta]
MQPPPPGSAALRCSPVPGPIPLPGPDSTHTCWGCFAASPCPVPWGGCAGATAFSRSSGRSLFWAPQVSLRWRQAPPAPPGEGGGAPSAWQREQSKEQFRASLGGRATHMSQKQVGCPPGEDAVDWCLYQLNGTAQFEVSEAGNVALWVPLVERLRQIKKRRKKMENDLFQEIHPTFQICSRATAISLPPHPEREYTQSQPHIH